MALTSSPSVQYFINHTTWRHDYDINGPRVFHVDNSTMRIGQPDMTFHVGPDENGPIAGICKFRHFSSDTDIGLSDPKQPDGMVWERMRREGMMNKSYHFRMEVGDHHPHNFTWKSTRSMGSGKAGDMKLVDDSTQEVVAVFLASWSIIKKTGQLDIHVNHGDRFQLMVLMSALAIREKHRRASNSRGVGATSAGGGMGGIGAVGFGGGGC